VGVRARVMTQPPYADWDARMEAQVARTRNELARIDTVANANSAASPAAMMAMFERLPAHLVVLSVLATDTDPWLRYEHLARRLATTHEGKERLRYYGTMRSQFVRAFANDTFWRHWVTHCFPAITYLPENTTTWRAFAKRIILALCTTRVAPMVTSHVANTSPFLEFALWPSFKLALESSMTCSQFFRRQYSTGFVVLNNSDLAVDEDAGETQFFQLAIGSEAFRDTDDYNTPKKTLSV
jgi:hypothetical protein